MVVPFGHSGLLLEPGMGHWDYLAVIMVADSSGRAAGRASAGPRRRVLPAALVTNRDLGHCAAPTTPRSVDEEDVWHELLYDQHTKTLLPRLIEGILHADP